MGAWFKIRSLALLRQVQGSFLIVLVVCGLAVGGAIWMMVLVATDLGVDNLRNVRHVGRVIDARRNFAEVCGRWYQVILVLHPFFIAIKRAAVNHVDGAGTAGLVCWCSSEKAWAFGTVNGSILLLHLSLLMMLGLGLTQSGSWLSGLLS